MSDFEDYAFVWAVLLVLASFVLLITLCIFAANDACQALGMEYSFFIDACLDSDGVAHDPIQRAVEVK